MPNMTKVGKTHTMIGYDEERKLHYVKYYDTKVVQWNNEKIILNTNGWFTDTTKNRMNQTANQFDLNYVVYQKDYQWYVQVNGCTIAFNGQQIVEFYRQ